MDWEEVADRLYGLPPDDFTSARDEAARSAPRGQAAKIRALRRPTLAAWAVNLLVRQDRDEIDALLALGEQLRRAHRELDGGQLRELSHQQHQLVTALSRRAQWLATEAGRPVGEGVLREVEATVHAALADPDAADELATGRLTKALEPPAAFGPPVTATVRRLRPRTAPSGRTAASGRTRPEVRERPATVTQLSERAEEQARAKRELREQLDRARSLAEELERTASASDKESETAERELADAEERRQRAETRVRELESELRQARQDAADAKRAERRARSSARKAGDVAADDRGRASEAAEQVERLLSQTASRGGRRRRR